MANGFTDATPPHKVLEMLLFYSIPRIDTNEIAHKLLDHFGSLANVLDATPEELKKVQGIGDNSAVMLNLISHICRRYHHDKTSKNFRPKTHDELCLFIERQHFGMTKEYFALTSLNSKGEIIAFDLISQGDITSVGVSTRKVIETAIERKAVAVIISHNHPSGTAIPTNDDIAATKRIAKALRQIDISLLDHVIAVDDDHVSLALSGPYRYIFEKDSED